MHYYYISMPLTLYAVSDGPPSLAVRQCLKYLEVDFKHVNVDFGIGEHMTDDFEKVIITIILAIVKKLYSILV